VAKGIESSQNAVGKGGPSEKAAAEESVLVGFSSYLCSLSHVFRWLAARLTCIQIKSVAALKKSEQDLLKKVAALKVSALPCTRLFLAVSRAC
jgi:hypothetical protein